MGKYIDGDIELLATDWEGTIYEGHSEINFGYFAVQRSLDEGRVGDALRIFSEDQAKAFIWLKRDGSSPKILDYLGKNILKGWDVQILKDFEETIREDFKENLSLPLRVPYMFIEKEAESGYYSGAIDTFSKVSTKQGFDTMIYSQSLEELIDLRLSNDDYINYFTEGIVGNRIKFSGEGDITGIEWEVDGPGVPIEEQKLGLLDTVNLMGYEPEHVAYIDDKNVGGLKKLKEEGGKSMLAPAADEEVRKWGRENDIYVSDSWDDIEEYLGI